MEYLKVVVPDRSRQDIDVLINGKSHGKVGEVLTLGKGIVLVSVDLPNAEEKQVDLCGTVPNYPKVTEIRREFKAETTRDTMTNRAEPMERINDDDERATT